MNTFKRGFLTDEIKTLISSFLGEDEEINKTHLRLMPYLMTCLMNNGILDLEKINKVELHILKTWDLKGFIYFKRKKGDVGYYEVKAKSVEFYNFVCKVLWYGYVIKDSSLN